MRPHEQGVGVKERKPLTRRKKVVRVIAGLLAIFIVFCVSVVTGVNVSSRPFRFSDASKLPHEDVAIVFGALVYPSGEPSMILQDRINGAITLYKSGIVKKLLMSGDNRVANYNEPEAMRQYAIRNGIPDADIILDFAGRDTYDTCYRAKNLFGIQGAILVTQNYHAPRAVYIARGLGMRAVAYGVPDFSLYPELKVPYSSREYLADIKAWWDVHIGHRPAQVM
jgi:vancomycin permeability regulator SanA